MADTDNTVEVKAREMGWRPQEEFRGAAENWVDAETFVKRGEEVLPLVKAENRRLHEKTDQLGAEIQRLTAALGEQRESMNEMAKFNLEQLQAKLDEQKRQLTRDLREAKREDNDDRIEELEGALDKNKEAREKLAKAPAAAPPAAPQAVPETPEYKAWVQANSWFGGNTEVDAAKTAAAQRFGVEIAAAGKRGQAFFDAVDEKMAKAFPTMKRADPTEDGRPSGGAGQPTADKGFNALPTDAKQKAREQISRFVGTNKMFKTEQAWFDYYAKQYNTEAA